MQRRSYVYSAAFHASLVAVGIFGLPYFERERVPEPPVILAELAPIAEKSNVPKPQPIPVEAKQEPKQEPEPPKPEAKPEPPKPVTAAPPPPPPPPPPPQPQPKPVEAAKPTPPPPEPLPKPEVKPEPPKPVAKPEPPKPPAPPQQTQAKSPDFSSVAALVNKMQKPAPAPQQQAQAQPQVAQRTPAPRAIGPSDPSQPLSISEKDFIASQIYDKWALDCGRRDAREHVVRVQFQLNPDGSLKTQPEVLDAVRLYTQENYRASAEAARRAVFKAVPFKFPPNTDIAKFTQEIVLNFDPRTQCNS